MTVTPSTTTRNLLLYLGAYLLAIVLAGGVEASKQLHGDAAYTWRPVLSHMLDTALELAAPLAMTMGLPRLGKEAVAMLTSRVGTDNAKAALEGEAVRQAVGGDSEQPFSVVQVDQIASRLLELRAEHAADAEGHPLVVVPRRGVEPPTIADDGGEA
jgi:hypothetical protein